MSNLKDVIINSDIYVSIVALGLGLLTYYIYNIPLVDLTPLLLIFLLTFNVYAINRQTDQVSDEINLPERTQFVKKYGRILFYLSIIGVLISIIISFNRSLILGIDVILTVICGYFYSYPFFHLGRFKDYVILKNVGVGLIYGFLALITPLYFGIINPIFLVLAFEFFFLRFFLISSFFDLRDVEGDRQTGITTIPLLLQSETLRFFHLLNLLPIVIFLTFTTIKIIDASFLLVGILTSFYGLIYLLGFKLKLNMKFLCMVIADGEPFIIVILLFMAKFLL